MGKSVRLEGRILAQLAAVIVESMSSEGKKRKRNWKEKKKKFYKLSQLDSLVKLPDGPRPKHKVAFSSSLSSARVYYTLEQRVLQVAASIRLVHS